MYHVTCVYIYSIHMPQYVQAPRHARLTANKAADATLFNLVLELGAGHVPFTRRVRAPQHLVCQGEDARCTRIYGQSRCFIEATCSIETAQYALVLEVYMYTRKLVLADGESNVQ